MWLNMTLVPELSWLPRSGAGFALFLASPSQRRSAGANGHNKMVDSMHPQRRFGVTISGLAALMLLAAVTSASPANVIMQLFVCSAERSRTSLWARPWRLTW